nr:hypothetical protein Iba_chr02dCG8770 [Ipomoea batatas]
MEDVVLLSWQYVHCALIQNEGGPHVDRCPPPEIRVVDRQPSPAVDVKVGTGKVVRAPDEFRQVRLAFEGLGLELARFSDRGGSEDHIA